MNKNQEKMLKQIISESNTPGFENRRFGDSLPTLASVQKAYEEKNGIKEEDSVEEAAPRMKVTRYQKELDQAMQSIIRAQNMMALDQPGQYKRVDKAFIKIKKQFMQFKGLVNTVG
jgi:superfamily II RNA helicase